MNVEECGAYGQLAAVYDRLNAQLDYIAWADFIVACFERYADIRPSIILDLACGTGRMTLELARRGYDMIGIDGSAEMLSEASARRLNFTNPLYLMQDMRAFELLASLTSFEETAEMLDQMLGNAITFKEYPHDASLLLKVRQAVNKKIASLTE